MVSVYNLFRGPNYHCQSFNQLKRRHAVRCLVVSTTLDDTHHTTLLSSIDITRIVMIIGTANINSIKHITNDASVTGGIRKSSLFITIPSDFPIAVLFS